MSVVICKSLAALELGFLSCSLRTIQQTAWSKWNEDQLNISASLKEITRLLLAVGEGFDAQQWSLFDGLKAQVEDGHEQALQYRDDVLSQLMEEVEDEHDAYEQLPARLEEWAAERREDQLHAWEVMCLFTRKMVEHDPQLAAWWDLGFGIGSRVFRPDTKQALLAHLGGAEAGVAWDLKKLPEAEQTWVKGILPHQFESGVDGILRLLTAYHKLRAGLPEMDRQQGRASAEVELDETEQVAAPTAKNRRKRSEIPDDYEVNIRIKKCLDSHPGATIREVAKEIDVCTGRVSRLDAWREEKVRRNAAKPPPKGSERRLTDRMLASIGQRDDPADKLILAEQLRDAAIWRWVLETAEPNERAEHHKKNAEERATLIELAREMYDKKHPEPDD